MLLTERHDAAALRIAEGRATQERIADAVGVDRKTLWQWMKDPDFTARVEEHTALLHDAVVKRGAADKRRRLAGYVSRLQLLWQVIEERAQENARALEAEKARSEAESVLAAIFGAHHVAAGATTGLLVRQVKALGKMTVDEWAVDTGMLTEMRNLEKQLAQEMGEWTEKRSTEVTGKDGGAVKVAHGLDLDALTDEELDAVVAIRERLAALGATEGGQGQAPPA